MSQLITRRRSVSNAAPALSASSALGVSAPLIGEPTPLTEATPTTSQVPVSSTSSVSVEPLSARRPHRRRREPEPSDHTSSSSRVEDGASQPAKKNTRGPNRMLKELQLVRMSASLIKIAYDERHRGAVTSQQHNSVVNCCGFIIRNFCPMRWESWAKIPEETRTLVRDNLEVVFEMEDISPEVSAYLEETLASRYKDWKSALHKHFQLWESPEIARLQGCPLEYKERREDWEWLCTHFTDPKFLKKSATGKKARDSKTLLHHSGSKPFSYRVEARREEGSKFPQIDLFKHVYVHPNNEKSDQLYGDMVEKSTAILQEATSQLPPETPIEDIIVPKDADVQIVTEVLDQKFGRRHGKVVRCTGKAGVRKTGASSSRLSTGEVNSLKEEVTTLRGQVAAQGERMNMILQALAMSDLQIPTMPAPNVAPPSTSQPFRPDDTE
ncbi:uncharacterized protein [Malus domestica]|uniref:uncharacterized protein n=1 Tax=Malus domestica TaxID=3750 RepID=UPI0010AB1221|nr:uncharacterized protein LOC103449463 [Malus domestica]XP_028957063.1 uncharacterized protein LOC103449463 [Malus domestica]XP_028957064.1 uncharacterized protein LOC103449463 [Malus domestica]